MNAGAVPPGEAHVPGHRQLAVAVGIAVTLADPADNEFCVCTGVEW